MTATRTAARPRRVLLVLARDPLASRTGRMAVLETAVTSLRGQGHEVFVAAIADGPEGEWMGVPVHRIRPPRLSGLPVHAGAATVQGLSLNEAVLTSPRVWRQVRALVAELRADVVVGDGVRTWPSLRGAAAPVVMHLDDLLSDRYGSAAFRDGNDSVLGYYGDRIPPRLRGLAERAAHLVLRHESRRMRRREIDIARQAAGVAMTSADEARTLSKRAGVPVADLPMAVSPLPPGRPSEQDPLSFAFLGVLHYGPNLGALRYVRDQIIPVARARGIDLQVAAYGKADDAAMREFADAEGIRLVGYVDDLAEALRGHRGFLSTVLSGTGVKTKVLDALSVGLPVVATPLGVAGIPLRDGIDVLVAQSPEGIVDHIVALAEDGDRADRIGLAGRELLKGPLASERVARSWEAVIESAAGSDPGAERA
ncbi:glycosyltransferase [Micrococcus lylae]|uniref:glycosyltransferase n=1 Tax=Micrococcus lylae TaxID=1273 RepID=UPI002155DA17|nr:glycosyltransferase family 4 protein [Micrococcus lylae]WIK82378.1 glycosyltransferase family 4 protein [Micrococcus lylae]